MAIHLKFDALNSRAAHFCRGNLASPFSQEATSVTNPSTWGYDVNILFFFS